MMLRASLLVVSLCTVNVVLSSPLLKVQGSDVKTNMGLSRARSITTAPLNTAVVSGDRATLICASSTSLTLDWFFTPIIGDQSERVTLVTECQLNPAYDSVYVVEHVAAGQCNLVVLATTANEVGSYICVESSGSEPEQSAQLGILQSAPQCTVSTWEPIQGQTMTMTCEVKHTNNLPPAMMTWTDSQGQTVTSQSSSDGWGTTSWVELKADSVPVMDEYTCRTNFSDLFNNGTTASNAPDYTHEWKSPNINVQHCPTTMTFNATDGSFQQGDAVLCSADGYPVPYYTWTDEESGITTDGRVIVLNDIGTFNYTCKANVNIEGSECDVTRTIFVSVSSFSRRPQNTVVLLGTNETLGCQYESNPLNWFFVSASPDASAVWIVRSCVVSVDFVGYIEVDSSSGGCDLILLNAILFHGGRYTCQDVEQTQRPSSSLVIILESSPVCSVNVTDGLVIERDVILYHCSMNYSGTLKPQFTWLSSDNEIITNATIISTDTHIETYIEIPAYPAVVPSFSCVTYFDAPPPPQPPFLTDSATNRPAYTDTWTSPQLRVQYCPTTVTITPFTTTVFVGDVLTCSADGFPDPEYEWENMATAEFFPGPSVTITEPGSVLYRCTATSRVGGQLCSRSALFIAMAYDATSPQNQADLTGEDVTFRCRSSTQHITWMHAPVGTTSSVSVASDCQIVPNFRDLFEIDSADLACNLIVKGAVAWHAGTYNCQDITAESLPTSAQLIVLESHPECRSNATDNTANAGQLIEFSCRVVYQGNIPPVMLWFDKDGNPVQESSTGTTHKAQVLGDSGSIEDGSHKVDSAESSSISLTEKLLFDSVLQSSIAVLAQGESIGPYTCRTFFNALTGSPPDHLLPATNAPPYTYNWSSPLIPVTEDGKCWSAPCLSGGTCVDIADGYICTCTPEHTGLNCETSTDRCESAPCLNGAECQSGVNEYTCTCKPGYTGVNCQTDIDECASAPCVNGQCQDGVNGYTCTCQPGYTGYHCETDIDECASAPCLNGAECQSGVNVYTCTCKPGYTGVNCQTDIDECASHPCLNTGVCEDGVGGYTCICKPGFTGYNCEIDIDECENVTCENGGVCVSGVEEYICSCRPGFTGAHCETDIDECASNPCVNGQCQDGHGDYGCICQPGYTGHDCDVDIDECESAPCLNGAECQSGVNEYTCTCKPGYTGVNCQTDIDDCESAPCLNGALCQDAINGFICTCQPGFTGFSCETDIDECESQPCVNEGQCESGINNYNCTCQPGYGGDNCEIDVDECESSPCLHDGTCESSVNNYTCSCPPEYTGHDCEEAVDLSDCRSSPCQNDGTCHPLETGYTCTCGPLYTGIHCETSIHGRLQHCAAIRVENGSSAESGVYVIFVASLNRSIAVYCDMTTDGGGWTVLQRRQDGSLEFKETYENYAKGFGDLSSEFWLGNDYIAALTADSHQKLRLDMADWQGQQRYQEYFNFSVADASESYRIKSVGPNNGTAGDSFSYYNNMRFTTLDQDNDLKPDGNCAIVFRGAGWFNNCLRSNPNGEYNNTIDGQGIYWVSWRGPLYSMRYIDMKIRPIDFIPPVF